MRKLNVILFVSLLLYRGLVNAEPVVNVVEPQPNVNTLPATQSNDAQTQIEQAADHFDAFSLKLPKVIAAKLDAFRTHGFRAILLDDPETKPAEEAMIDSLAKGLKALGNSLEEDLSRSSTKTQAQNPDINPPDSK